jgi:cardiolipin synthase
LLFWLLGLMAMVGGFLLLVYVLYGDPGRPGFARLHRALKAEWPELEKLTRDSLAPYLQPDTPQATTLERLGGLCVQGNQVTLLPRGETAFAPIFTAIDAARQYVLVQFYIVRDDQLGHQLRERLVAAAVRGVRVYVLFDKIESSVSAEYLAPFAAAGIEVVAFRPERKWNRLHWKGFRNHRKMVLVDAQVAIVGGINVADEYVDRVPKRAPWIDTQVEIRGPAVLATQAVFARDYYCACRKRLKLCWQTEPAASPGCQIAVLATDPDPRLEACTLMFATAMNSARQRIWLATPYFIPDEKGLCALELAALRGVEVRILLPGSSDVYPTELLAWYYIERLQPLGVRFFLQNGGSMHQKVLLIDDHTALVGSANYDQRSFHLNMELTAWMHGPDPAALVEELLLGDFANCREVSPQEVAGRSRLSRLATALTRIVSPVM